MPRVAFLCEASASAGLGHLRRCAVLARACQARGAEIEFWGAGPLGDDLLPGWVGEKVPRRPAATGLVDWLVWDVRDPQSAAAAAQLRPFARRILSLDELGTARLAVDVVVDALMTPARAARSEESPDTRYHYGLAYLLLDEARLRPAPAADRAGVVVAFGGSDAENLAVRLFDALGPGPLPGPLTVVAGLEHPDLPRLRNQVEALGGRCLDYAPDLPAILRTARLVVTKLGLTTFESFRLGVPCLLLEPTPAHEQLARELADSYPDWPAWNHGLATPESLPHAAQRLRDLATRPAELAAATARAARFVPAGGGERVTDLLLR